MKAERWEYRLLTLALPQTHCLTFSTPEEGQESESDFGLLFSHWAVPLQLAFVCLAVHQDLISSTQNKKSPIKGSWVVKSKPQSQKTLPKGFSFLTQCRGGSITLWTEMLLDEARHNVSAWSHPPSPTSPSHTLPPAPLPLRREERQRSCPTGGETSWSHCPGLLQAAAAHPSLCPRLLPQHPGHGRWPRFPLAGVVALTSKQWNCI